tara:strand:+ start:2926 stop:3114 length:189 start_codon:yes stop_codon:yes gene_type:complete
MKHLSGGMTHNEIWALPISARRLYLRMVTDDIKATAAAREDAQKSSKKQQARMPNPSRNMHK